MSLFDDDEEEGIRKSIDFFMSLSPEDKARIVSHLLKMDEGIKEKLEPLLFAIRNDISTRDRITLSNKLFEMGMDRTYSVLFVGNMIDQAPTMNYLLAGISKMNDDDFKEKFPAMMKSAFVDNEKIEWMVKEYGMSRQQTDEMVDVMRTFMNRLARSDTSEDKIREICQESGLSNAKIDSILNTFKINLDFWKNMLVFSNTQDSFLSLQRIEQQNDNIASALATMSGMLKEILEDIKYGRRQ